MDQSKPNLNLENFIELEDYDANVDAEFIKSELQPYLKDLYKDLLMRSNQAEHVDKVTFIEYTKLPGIINDRLHVMFSENYNKNGRSPTNAVGSASKSANNSRASLIEKKKNEHVTMQSFVRNFTDIFIGDLNKKMQFTFNMYDFDGDGNITPEDVRIMLSYMPFKRNIQLGNVQNLIETRGMQNISPRYQPVDPNAKPQPESTDTDEGIYKNLEGKNVDYSDRLSDQDAIRQFIEQIFNKANHMNFKQYEYINHKITSEMFYSLMAIMHECLPCAQTFFRLKKKYRDTHYQQNNTSSPVRMIASPTMIRGLSITKKNRDRDRRDSLGDAAFSHSPMRSSQPNLRNFKAFQAQQKNGNGANGAAANGNSSRPSTGVVNNKQGRQYQSISPSKNGSAQVAGLKTRPTPGQAAGANKNVPAQARQPNGAIGGAGGKTFKQQITLATPSELQALSKGPFNLPDNPHNDGSKSPHQLVTRNKFRFHEEQKYSETLGNEEDEESKYMKSFSPINTKKGYGIRFNVGAADKSKTSFNLDAQNIFSQAMMDENEDAEQDAIVEQEEEEKPLQRFGDYENQEEKVFEGQCYLKTKTDRYKEHWAVLAGNELYCYRQKSDQEYRIMHSLIGTFIKEQASEESQSEGCNLYPVKIVLPPNKSRILYFKQRKTQKDWLYRLREIVGCANLFDYYKFEDNLGQGQFGLVKLAQHTKTGKKVAIKTIHKKDMKPIEIYQQRREIDVLKMSQHPNIVALIDLFENSDYYYIVLEYMQGKDLFDYIQYRNFKLTEQRVKELSYQIGIAIKYLHSYGIVHRDLKLENVMMSDNTEISVPKLVDFGLAKMIGPKEKADDPFGTLGYVAPEVLRKEPYSFSCDLWSFGCVIYALLSGSLPFDHESQKETVKMTLENELEFDLHCWESISRECKDLLTKLLLKDPRKRISLDNALKHKWFQGIEQCLKLQQQQAEQNMKIAAAQAKQKKHKFES